MIITAEKYNDLKPLSGEANALIVNKIVSEYEGKPDAEMRRRYASSGAGGGIFILDSAKHPGVVVEHIPGLNGDSVSTLFVACGRFNAPADMLRAREDLIAMVERSEGASPGKLAVKDEARGRKCFLQELSTGQLLDLVQRAVMKGHAGARA